MLETPKITLGKLFDGQPLHDEVWIELSGDRRKDACPNTPILMPKRTEFKTRTMETTGEVLSIGPSVSAQVACGDYAWFNKIDIHRKPGEREREVKYFTAGDLTIAVVPECLIFMVDTGQRQVSA